MIDILPKLEAVFGNDINLEITATERAGADLSAATATATVFDRGGATVVSASMTAGDTAGVFTYLLTSGASDTVRSYGKYRARYSLTYDSQNFTAEQEIWILPTSAQERQARNVTGPLTRRVMRERIRHNLNKRTAFDESVLNEIGDAASTHPWPSNDFLNEQIDEAVRALNRRCNLGVVDDVEIEVESTTTDGPQRILLRGVQPSLYDAIAGQGGDIHTVRRAYIEISGTLHPLTPLDRAEYDRSGRQWETEDAGTPRYYWLEGSALYLLPGTDTDATLHLIAGTGIIGFKTDDDTLLQLPNDYHSVVVALASKMTAESQMQDTEMESYAGLYRNRSEEGIQDIVRWKRGQTAELQASLYIQTGRVTVGRRG